MFSQCNTVGSRFSRRVGSFKKFNNRVAGKLMIAAVAAAGLGFANSAMGALADVTSIQTLMVGGVGSTVSNDKGGGNSSGFTSGRSYKMVFAGDDLKITKISTASASYVPSSLATTVVDRGSGPNTDTIWYAGTGTYNTSTLNLLSAPVSSVPQAFSGNNLLVGADNIFTNTGNNQANNTNIERLDLVFAGGITASSNNVFSIFERGLTGQHDGFKIAAITAVDGNGNPSDYGPLVTVAGGTYGKTDDVSTQEFIVTRKNDSISGDLQHPSDKVFQPIGGIVIPTDNLATDGEKIFGYSLFATDVTGSGTELVNWKDTSFFPSNTPETLAGLDLVGTAAVLYTNAQSPIPEPATGTLALVAATGLMARRSKRRRA
jgi:hypothetical protein